MKRYLPLLLTAFAGSLPAAREPATENPMVREAESADETRSSRTAIKLWVDPRCAPLQPTLLRSQVTLAHLTDDALSHWNHLRRTSPSRYVRWEAHRRELMCRAWTTGRKASYLRLQRLENPHPLTLREVHLEFETGRPTA